MDTMDRVEAVDIATVFDLNASGEGDTLSLLIEIESLAVEAYNQYGAKDERAEFVSQFIKDWLNT